MVTTIDDVLDKYLGINPNSTPAKDRLKSFKEITDERQIDMYHKRAHLGLQGGPHEFKGGYGHAVDHLYKIGDGDITTEVELSDEQGHEVIFEYIKGVAKGNKDVQSHLDAFGKDFDIKDEKRREHLYTTLNDLLFGGQFDLKQVAEDLGGKKVFDAYNLMGEVANTYATVSIQFEKDRLRQHLIRNRDLPHLIDFIPGEIEKAGYQLKEDHLLTFPESLGILSSLYSGNLDRVAKQLPVEKIPQEIPQDGSGEAKRAA